MISVFPQVKSVSEVCSHSLHEHLYADKSEYDDARRESQTERMRIMGKVDLNEVLSGERGTFGIEIEMTGITRAEAAGVIASYFRTSVDATDRHLDTRRVYDGSGRCWKVVSDSSITPQKKEGGRRVSASTHYQVEVVSPILTYGADMGTLQEIVRALRKAGAFTSGNCGIHIHLDGSSHTARSIRNFVNIIASKEDLLYDALRISPDRKQWCRKTNARLVEQIRRRRPKSMSEIEEIWYGTCQSSSSRRSHYHSSRYHMLNLHSLFQPGGNHTVELRCFNAGDENQRLHAGLVRSYVALALALNHQALTQRCASAAPCQAENKHFAMRTYLNRLGFIGPEFKNCRDHLTKHLPGNAAWRFRTAA